MQEHRSRIASPLGRLTLVATDRGLRSVSMARDLAAGAADIGSDACDHPVLVQAATQLGEYFARTRTAFDLPLDAAGTPFQQEVWAMLRTIPYGETRSYLAIAVQLGRPTATRAVGAANGRNPIAIITPCHRVIGRDGSLTGFAGGLENKRLLLALEGRSETLALPL